MRRASFAGLLGAAVAAALSVVPSLVPRSGPIQGLLTGVLAAIGYGAGTLLGWAARSVRGRADWRAGTTIRGLTAALLLGLVGASLTLGRSWQADVAGLTGAPAPGWGWIAGAAAVAVGVFALLVALARAARWATRRLDMALQRIAPPQVATASAVTVSLVLGAVAVDRVPAAATDLLMPVFRAANADTPAGVNPPTSPVVSGGPSSSIPWTALGAQGKDFVSGVTPLAELEEFSGDPAREPIRVFVGIDSATTAAGRAQLVLEELERFGAFQRAVIAVGTSAGSGIVDPSLAVPLEYLCNGDVATVSTQYSLLPSFLSFLTDRSTAVAESRAVITAVRLRLEQIPVGQRPRLVVFGESLGAYGSSGAFDDLPELLEHTDGGLFVGPPNGTALWRRYTSARRPGTPEYLPVYREGWHLRWAHHPTDLTSPATAFEAPRIAYLQNPSDPVVWWTPSLLWSRPDWLAEARGPGVLDWPWLPLFTFAGLSGDMIDSQSVPAGHGHVYGTAPAAVWADVLRRPGWTAQDTARLQRRLTR